MKNGFSRIVVVAGLLAFGGVAYAAEQVVTTDLHSPTKVIFSPRGNLIIAEAGTTANTGRISIVNRATSERRTLIDGLPSAIDAAEGDASGPSGLALRGNTLYVVIAQGDAVLNGPIPGTQTVNVNPSSGLLSSILSIDFGRPIDDMTGGLTLNNADQTVLLAKQPDVVGTDTNTATLNVVANLDNYRAEPRADYPANVRASDPYGIAIIGDSLYIADAGWNSIRKVNRVTGATSTLTAFPSVTNTITPGPVSVDAVPDSIRVDGDRLLVTLLTGYPFVAGLSSVVAVDPGTGEVTPVATGLTTAIDVVPSGSTGSRYVISEFSASLTQGTPGRIILYDTSSSPTPVVAGQAKSSRVKRPVPQSSVTVIDPSILSPSSIAVDFQSGDIFVTQIFTGTLVKVSGSNLLDRAEPSSIIPIVGSVGGALGSRFETAIQITNPQAYAIAGNLVVHEASGDKVLPYQLSPNETVSYPNLFSVIGGSGVATADVQATVGPSPRIVTRIYDTSKSAAATGGIVDQLKPSDAIQAGESAVVTTGSDPAVARTNVGLRGLNEGATVIFALYRADGSLVGLTTRGVNAGQVIQFALADLFPSPVANESLIALVEGGSAIIFSSTVNNTTQETTWVRAPRVE